MPNERRKLNEERQQPRVSDSCFAHSVSPEDEQAIELLCSTTSFSRGCGHAECKKRFEEGIREILLAGALSSRAKWEETNDLKECPFIRFYHWLFVNAPYEWLCEQVRFEQVRLLISHFSMTVSGMRQRCYSPLPQILKGFSDEVKEVLGREALTGYDLLDVQLPPRDSFHEFKTNLKCKVKRNNNFYILKQTLA